MMYNETYPTKWNGATPNNKGIRSMAKRRKTPSRAVFRCEAPATGIEMEISIKKPNGELVGTATLTSQGVAFRPRKCRHSQQQFELPWALIPTLARVAHRPIHIP